MPGKSSFTENANENLHRKTIKIPIRGTSDAAVIQITEPNQQKSKGELISVIVTQHNVSFICHGKSTQMMN